MEPIDRTLYTSEELHFSIGRNPMAMTPFDVNYLWLRKQEKGDQVKSMPNGEWWVAKHHIAEIVWREVEPNEIFSDGFKPLLAFDNSVLNDLAQKVRGLNGQARTDESEALRRENEHLRAQNQKLIETVLGVVERRTK